MIAVAFLVSYDYQLLKWSLPLVYNKAGKIVLAIDVNRRSFTGAIFQFDEQFKSWISKFDTSHKIQWVEEAFYEYGLTPFEVVLRKRNRMLQVMQPADWFIQLDADEYFLNFGGFVSYLHALAPATGNRVAVSVKWKTIFKEVESGWLVIAGRTERIQVATNYPVYTSERGHVAAEGIDSNFFMLHQSWARSSAEIKTKVENWSHAKDFNTMAFYHLWLSCNLRNYKKFINFHPIHGLLWPRLEFVKAGTIGDLIEHYGKYPPGDEKPNPKPILLRLKSSLKSLLNST